MCFMIYLGTKTPPRPLPIGTYPPGTALVPLRPGEEPIRDKFSLQHVSSIKLAQGCGCWLRYVDSDDVEHPPDFNLLPPKEGDLEQPNHDSLADYLQAHFHQDGFVEFFGYFYGDAAQPARAYRETPVAAIHRPDFQFHGGTLHRLSFS
jgi:hypothetical protein